MIPETHYDPPAVRVEGYRSFGNTKGTTVTTYIFSRREDLLTKFTQEFKGTMPTASCKMITARQPEQIWATTWAVCIWTACIWEIPWILFFCTYFEWIQQYIYTNISAKYITRRLRSFRTTGFRDIDSIVRCCTFDDSSSSNSVLLVHK